MSRRIASLAAVLAVFLCAPAAWGAVPTWHTKRQAELNLLRAPHRLAPWHVSLVDRRTRLFHRNTTAVCRGRGRPAGGRYAGFTCQIRNGRVVVQASYVARARGFEARRLSVSRASGR